MGRFLFGPVNSRRLGRSLGVDLLPFKTCSLDCIYCECGWTTDKTLSRAELVPTSAVLAELDDYLGSEPELDCVTFPGSGEPTLHSGIGMIIAHLKKHYPQYKVAVLTNSTLLGDLAVQAQLAQADIVVPSLDGATEAAFQEICRPAVGLTVQTVIDGIAAFRRRFSGLLLTFIAPDAIQLNNLDRPAPHPGVTRPSIDALQDIRAFFHPLQVQTVRRRGKGEPAPWSDPLIFQEILRALETGSATLGRLSVATGIREGDLVKTLAQMSAEGLLQFEAGSCKVRPPL